MSENEQDNKTTATSNLDIKLWAVGSVLFILMSVFGYLAYLNLHFPLFSRGDYATLGDSFGILSSLFSGLAFAGLIVTIVMQNKTLKAQMEELELTRGELSGQKKVMEEQLQAIKLQQFETTFFKLIDNHRSIISSYSLALGDPETDGKYANGFEYIKAMFNSVGNINYYSNKEIPSNRAFYKFYYFGLVKVVEVIRRNFNINEEKEKYLFYIDILKSYISSEEMTCLYFLLYRFKSESFFDENLHSCGLFDDYEVDGFVIGYPPLCNSSDLILRMDVFDMINKVGVVNSNSNENPFFARLDKVRGSYQKNFNFHIDECFDFITELKKYDLEIDKGYKYMFDNFPVEDLIDLYIGSTPPAFLRKYRIGECENAFTKDLVVNKEYYFSLKEDRQRIAEEKKEFEDKRDNLNYCINVMNQILSRRPLTPDQS